MLESAVTPAALFILGKYLFMAIASDLTQIDKVELSQKKIVDTPITFPMRSPFSPDERWSTELLPYTPPIS